MCKTLSVAQEERMTTTPGRVSLPVPLTSFVGGEQEIATVCALLRRSQVRLLTLIGSGGVGKTRLSLQVATLLSKDFADQVCFVSLTEISDPQLVMPTIAQALGLQELGGRPILDHLKAFLYERPLLLVLDNFEQVREAGPALADLLESCSGLKILVTSRAILRISGEHTFLVPPLALPDLSRLPDQDELLQYPAIALFVERAKALLPDFQLQQENSRTVAEICVRLDGLPLAIELAVPLLKAISLRTLLARLEHRFQVLTHGMYNAPKRQQTLQNTLEWSYSLLSSREQHLFRSLAVFVGGCTLQAIEAVWELTGHPQEREQVLEGVASLLDKSMLIRSSQEIDEPRLLMLRTMQEYGWQCLRQSGELERLQWAHASYYLLLAEEAEPELKGPHPRPWLEKLQREHDNIREALSFLIAHGEHEGSRGTELALRMGKALERFWIIGGHVKEGRDLLERALQNRGSVSSLIRGNALCIASTLARYLGDFHYATTACQESLEIFRELENPVGIAGSLYRLGYVAWMRGESNIARAYYEESLMIGQGEKCWDVRSETLYCFASLAFFQEDSPMARFMIEESLALSRALEDQFNIASALNILGWISFLQEDISTAQALQEESLAACRALGNQRGVAHTLSALGEIAYTMGDLALASERYEESLVIIMRIDDRWAAAVYMEAMARVVAAHGEAIRAVHLLSAAQSLRQVMGTSMTLLEKDIHEQTLASLHEALDKDVFTTAWNEGLAMSPEQAIVARQLSIQAPPAPLPRKKQPVIEMPALPSLHDDLTQREREVLSLVAQGLTDIQVAKHLSISHRTVNFHLTSIYRKLQVSSRSAATRYALESHLL